MIVVILLLWLLLASYLVILARMADDPEEPEVDERAVDIRHFREHWRGRAIQPTGHASPEQLQQQLDWQRELERDALQWRQR
jgi:hypothetical protein